MSAQFMVLFNGRPVRFAPFDERRVFSLASKGEATVFISEADGWCAARKYRLRPVGLVQVVSAMGVAA